MLTIFFLGKSHLKELVYFSELLEDTPFTLTHLKAEFKETELLPFPLVILFEKATESDAFFLLHQRSTLNPPPKRNILIIVKNNQEKLFSELKDNPVWRKTIFQITTQKIFSLHPHLVFESFLEQTELAKHQAQLTPELDLIDDNISKLSGKIEQELQHLKTVHEKFFSKKRIKLPGLTLYTKYLPGTKSRSDFFDIIRFKGPLVFIMISTSYTKMPDAMNVYLLFNDKVRRGHYHGRAIEDFLEQMDEILNEDSESDFFFAILDPRTLLFEIFRQKKALLLNFGPLRQRPSPLFDNLYSQSAKLKRGEKYFIFSQGLQNSWSTQKMGSSIPSFISRRQEMAGHDIITEVFYYLTNASDENFLKEDSTTLLIEVQNNVIHEA